MNFRERQRDRDRDKDRGGQREGRRKDLHKTDTIILYQNCEMFGNWYKTNWKISIQKLQ